jgi:hypothetical protein
VKKPYCVRRHRNPFWMLAALFLFLAAFGLVARIDLSVLHCGSLESESSNVVAPDFCINKSFASEESSADKQTESKSTHSDIEAGESTENGASSEASDSAEEQTVKYSVFQDFCALVVAMLIIFSAYALIKRKAGEQQEYKNNTDKGG